jgi:hypothetical protein
MWCDKGGATRCCRERVYFPGTFPWQEHAEGPPLPLGQGFIVVRHCLMGCSFESLERALVVFSRTICPIRDNTSVRCLQRERRCWLTNQRDRNRIPFTARKATASSKMEDKDHH